MTRSRKKKALVSPGNRGKSRDTSVPFEFRTPSPPPISKDSMFYLMDELEEARRNLEAWWAQVGPEVKEGISKFTTDLALGLRYAQMY